MQNHTPRAGDDVDEVLQLYSGMIYQIAFSHTGNKPDAEDVFQSVFLKYITCRKIFENEEHRKAYLIRMVLNQSKSLFLSAWFRKTKPLSEEIIFDTPEDSGIYSAVLSLPFKYRTVIWLHYYEDMSVKQISNTLGIRESTIKSQLHRARNMLREHLKGEFDHVWREA